MLKISKKTIITGSISIIGISIILILANLSSVIGSIPGFSSVNDLEVKDEFVYINDVFGLTIVDTTNPSIPLIIGTVGIQNPQWISLQEDYVLLQDGSGDLQIVDVSDPYKPEIVSVLENEGVAVIQNSLLYSLKSPNTMLSGRLSIYDFSNPTNPVLISMGEEVVDWAKDFKLIDNYGYVIGGEALLTILDLNNPSEVKILSAFFDDGIDRHGGQHIQIYDNIAYITDFDLSTLPDGSVNYNHVLYAINISDPLTPKVIWKLDSMNIENIWIEPDLLYCTSNWNGLKVFDISNTHNPVLIDSYSQVISPWSAVEVHNNKIYITGGMPYLLILDNLDLGRLFLSSPISIFQLPIFCFTVVIGLLSIGFFISDFKSGKRKNSFSN